LRFFIPCILSYILPIILFGVPALADDNIANCEIVVQQAIEADPEQEGKQIEGSAQIATFLPAADFIFSVFDAEEGHITEIDDKPIRAVMCVRSSVIPTEFDFKIIRTEVPFYLSPDFDAKNSALLGVSKSKDGYVYDYVGPDLPDDDIDLLKLRMKLLNKKEPHHED